MTGEELKQFRRDAGMSVVQFGWWLGYRGSNRTISRLMRAYERGTKSIPFELTDVDLAAAVDGWDKPVPQVPAKGT